jgi:predicted kinase
VTTVELPRPARPRHAPPSPRPQSAAPVRVRLPGRALLLVAGMPGAGKSTLLAGLARRPGLVVLDSDTHRAALARRLPMLAYRRYRPLVHLLHRLALVRAAVSAAPTVVVHLPATAGSTRAAVAAIAAVTGRAAHLLWLHVDPRDALAGQRDRGRVVPAASFAGHARRATATLRRLRRARPWGYRDVTVLDRARARAGLVLDARAVKARSRGPRRRAS